MPRIGDILSEKYRLVRQLGKGAMGAVFEAEHLQLGKRVAIKALHRRHAKNPNALARFEKEARAASSTGHPSTIDIHDLGTAPDGAPFLVMELLEGRSLAQILKHDGALDVGRSAYIVCQVLSALDAVHAEGILHRDVKPQNIIVAAGGGARGAPTVKILDFGVAKILDDTNDMRLTQTGVLVGTPSFMAPEQVRGQKDIDARADVYAAGVVLYMCLSGRRPYDVHREDQLYLSILEGRIVPLSEQCPSIGPSLAGIVHRAMAVSREDRFESAAEMLAGLLQFVEPWERDDIPVPESIQRPADDDETTDIDMSGPSAVPGNELARDLAFASTETGPRAPDIRERRTHRDLDFLREAAEREGKGQARDPIATPLMRPAARRGPGPDADTLFDPDSAPYREAEAPSRSPTPPSPFDDSEE